jgi:hypothetical protein
VSKMEDIATEYARKTGSDTIYVDEGGRKAAVVLPDGSIKHIEVEDE